MKAKSATGTTGILIRTFDSYMFRVYSDDYSFVDYELHHCDLEVTINDTDAYFYHDHMLNRLDHSPPTLGLVDENI
jgi:hypothetical protein